MSKVANNVLISILVFLLVFCWMQYYTKMPTLSVLTAIGASIICCAILQIVSKRPTKKDKKSAKKKELAKLATHLTFSTNNDTLLTALFAKSGYTTAAAPGGFVLTKNDVDTFAAFEFDADGANSRDVVSTAKYAKIHHCDKALLFCISTTKNARGVREASDILIRIVDIEQIYSMLVTLDLLPELKVKALKRPHIVLSYALNKKRFGYYLMSAIFLAVISIFSYFPIYTLVWSTLLLFVALYCLLNRRYNDVSPNADYAL